jgi:hypothetical protein
MTSTLKIEPESRKKTSLSDELKFALRKSNKSNIRIDEDNLDYFKGLRDAGIQDASIVIDFIEKYGACTLEEEY